MISLQHGLDLLRQAMDRLERALAPKGEICLCCGSEHRHKALLPLCRRCWEVIPWILQVDCPVCGRYESCPDCGRRQETWFVRNRSVVRYDEQMKEWLAQYKYRGQERLRGLFGRMLLHAYHLHRSAQGIKALTEIVTYVPLSEERYMERGFNQAEQMAAELGKLAGLPVIPLLRRARHTDKQSFKARAERLDDLRGAFVLDPVNGGKLSAAAGSQRLCVYIIDDVYTTGSTLNECARTLRGAGDIEVYGLSWAR
ncbi:ComF family protein [Paenibacillus filicis]|uniref:ComF family protein n=1 Tax=Paenibacillus gyeongsangnamensis TaxID=3388067 RepID=A0ABT4QDB2_9BACL|nr:ComF family protein [Paenibacillus filicis]MCZ8514868.1 ComF family protein [Paenibacillus filicis]